MSEEFEVVLSSPSAPAKLGRVTTASVMISGPNDGKRDYIIIFNKSQVTGKVYQCRNLCAPCKSI